MNKNENSTLNIDFEREAIPHMDALRNFALKLTSDSDDANDLLQDTFVRAYRFFNTFEQGTNCKSWLFMIMRNLFINSYRKKSSGPILVDYSEIDNFYENVKPSNTDEAHLEKDMFDNLLNDEIQEAISTLPDDFRTVILLSDIEGFTYDEIADFVDCPVGTVRSRIHRARKMLFVKLQKYAKSRGYAKEERE